MPNNLSLSQAAIAYLAALVVILALDALWLGVVAKNIYMVEMGLLMNETPRWGPALVFYLLYPAGLVFLVTVGGMPDIGGAALRGAVVGAMAYGAYNATNLSVIRGFSDKLALIDFCWGTVLTAAAGAAVGWAVGRFR
ncbi:DUF2177 family protein [Xylophilus sp. Kf1]|nr:DUF2177 family protein [Xylophilus sp. Kf1]